VYGPNKQYPLDYLRTTPLKFNTKTGHEQKKKVHFNGIMEYLISSVYVTH
jgi:hypothetical protein